MPVKTESVKVPTATMRNVRKQARETGVKITFIVNMALRAYLSGNGKKRQ